MTTHESWSRPPRSPTIVGSAVDTIVWSSDASSIASRSPEKVRADASALEAHHLRISSHMKKSATTPVRCLPHGRRRAQGLRERKKLQTRELIAETARRLFAERGFEAVTVAEVARAADVAEKTVFNYFPTKEDLVYWRLESFEETSSSARSATARPARPCSRRSRASSCAAGPARRATRGARAAAALTRDHRREPGAAGPRAAGPRRATPTRWPRCSRDETGAGPTTSRPGWRPTR